MSRKKATIKKRRIQIELPESECKDLETFIEERGLTRGQFFHLSAKTVKKLYELAENGILRVNHKEKEYIILFP